MIQNQFKIAFRNFKKNKTFSLINILGLSLGMACCFLSIVYCWHEFNYDTFHKNVDELYRVEYVIKRGGEHRTARIPSPIAPILKDYFPEIEAASRFYPRELSVELPENRRQFEIENVFFVDSSVVDVFEFDFLHGDAERAFLQPDAVVVSEETAVQLFGKTDVVGEALRLAGEGGYRISGVVKSWADNSHLAFNMLLPFETMIKVEPEHAREGLKGFVENNWSATHTYTYVKLQPQQDYKKVNAKFKNFIQEKVGGNNQALMGFNLIPIQEIHLLAEAGGPKPSGNKNYLYLFLSVGFITLLIACINFINISTASSMARAKEVGVRKVLGAQRSSLVSQFLAESVLLSFLSFLIAFGMTVLVLPALNNLTGISIPYMTLFQPIILGSFFSIFLLTGFLAGLYPAFFVTRFQPVSVLKGKMGNFQKPWNRWLRKGLITVQFLAAIAFIAIAIVLYLQIKYLGNQPLGFNQELMVCLPLDSGNNLNAVLRPGDATLRQRMNTFDESLMSNPNIKAVTQCSRLPGLGTISRGVSSESNPQAENLITKTISVDYDFTETFDLELLTGRDFDASFGTDHLSAFLINEKAVKHLSMKNPAEAIGQKMVMERKEGLVIGVLKDFHFESLHSEIIPLVLEVQPGGFGYFALRIGNTNVQETLAFVEEKWKTAFPAKGFEYTFLEETINETYQAEQKLSSIIGYFAFIAIFISCFGLFGLAALLTQQRFKEIGIRKVLGASVQQILGLISKDFIQLIAVAMLLATPLTWYFLKDWLSNFAYRIDYPWWVTAVSGVSVMLIAFVTISLQSVRAAVANPVDAIKEE